MRRHDRPGQRRVGKEPRKPTRLRKVRRLALGRRFFWPSRRELKILARFVKGWQFTAICTLYSMGNEERDRRRQCIPKSLGVAPETGAGVVRWRSRQRGRWLRAQLEA